MSADVRLSHLWGDPTLTTKARLLLLAMWTFADEHALCSLTIEQLSTQTGIRRAVVVALLDMLTRKGRMRRMGWGGTAYQLLAPYRDAPVAPAARLTVPVRVLAHCAAGSDGDCNHPQCPQNRDGEPHHSGRHCPIDHREESYT